MGIPAHLQSTFDLLTRAFGDSIEERNYMALLAVLGEHMCEENIRVTVAHRFGRDAERITNDLAKVQSVQAPHADSVEDVRSNLDRAGLEDWLREK